jgi:hypothetical protein
MTKRSAALVIGFVVIVIVAGVVLFWTGLNPGSMWTQVFISFVALLVLMTVIALGRQAKGYRSAVKVGQPIWTRAIILATAGLLAGLAAIIGLLVIGKMLSNL